MQNTPISKLSDAELISQLAECISLEGEAKAAAKPFRAELLKRQTETGEVTIEHDGWQSILAKEKISAAWVEREYGYTADEIPRECYDEAMAFVLNGEKVKKWLEEAGHGTAPSFTIKVGRKKQKSTKA